MAKRTKTVVVSNVSRENFNDALAKYAASDAKNKAMKAEMDERFTAIREEYADRMAACEESKKDATTIIQTYCIEQKATLFSERRSMDTVHGTVGFRTGNPTLKLRNGYTWEAATSLLKVILPEYVRITEEPAKDKLLADRNTEAVAAKLYDVGLCVNQGETFFIELKQECETA